MADFQHTALVSTTDKHWTTMSLSQLADYWRSKTQDAILQYREDEDVTKLGGVAVAGVFDSSGRARLNNVVRPTGYVLIDYDDFEDLEHAEAFRNLVGQSNYTTLAAVSKSGRGVHVIIRVGRNLNIVKSCWYSILAQVLGYYDELTGYTADRQASSMSRVIFDTWDPGLIFDGSASFPLDNNTIYHGPERNYNNRSTINESLWVRVFCAIYSKVCADINEHGRIRHSTLVTACLPMDSGYSERLKEFFTEYRTGQESWGLDELESLLHTSSELIGYGSTIYMAQDVEDLTTEARAYLWEHKWITKVQLHVNENWRQHIDEIELALNAYYNQGEIPILCRAKPVGLRIVSESSRPLQYGELGDVFNKVVQFHTARNNDTNIPDKFLRECATRVFESLPEVDTVASTARVVENIFYGNDAYIPSHGLIIKPEKAMKDTYSVEESLAIWEEYCGQFAFASVIDSYNLLLHHLSPIFRSEATTWPILLTTKPNKSIGGTKSLEAGWYGLHTSEYISPTIPPGMQRGGRMIDTELASSRSELYLDNVFTLNYTSLKQAVVNPKITVDPKMRALESVDTKNLCIYASGINVSLDSEMRRRVLVCNLSEEAAIRQRAKGYKYPDLINTIRYASDMTDALLSLAYHYTQLDKVTSLHRYVSSFEQFSVVAYNIIYMCYGLDAANIWLDSQVEQAETTDIVDDVSIIMALQLAWDWVFDKGEQDASAADLLYWIKNDAEMPIQQFTRSKDFDSPASIRSTSTPIVDVLKRGSSTTLAEFVWQLKDVENQVFMVDEVAVKLVLENRRAGARRGTRCSMQVVELTEIPFLEVDED